MSVPATEVMTLIQALQGTLSEFAKTIKAETSKPKKKIKKVKMAKVEEIVEEKPKRRGRPPKSPETKAAETLLVMSKTKVEKVETKAEAKADAKSRGRPRKPENMDKVVPKRAAPAEPAKEFSVGDTKIGADGYFWIVAQRKDGKHFWKKAYLLDEIDEEPKEKKPRGRPPKDGVAKERKPRQCPDIKAKDAGLDAEETGLDGAIWKVFARPKSGHLFWKRV